MDLIEKINKEKLPEHIAIIMDGNGRWAKKKGNSRIFGHKNAISSVKEVTEAAAELQIKYLTLYAFSTENWNRPQIEVQALMTLLVSTINAEIKTLNKNNIRLLAIGNLKSLPDNVYKKLLGAIKSTEKNTGLSLVLALSYGSKWEITNAVKKIMNDYKLNKVNIEDISEDLINRYLETSEIPDPELLIRTSGEMRISNFLLWQIAYSELYFTDILWPDFRKENFFDAIIDYQSRERRFGKTSEQIKTN
ncbi:MAG: isoprenyl transferase [Bacteroidota bacterium]